MVHSGLLTRTPPSDPRPDSIGGLGATTQTNLPQCISDENLLAMTLRIPEFIWKKNREGSWDYETSEKGWRKSQDIEKAWAVSTYDSVGERTHLPACRGVLGGKYWQQRTGKDSLWSEECSLQTSSCGGHNGQAHPPLWRPCLLSGRQ